LYAINAVKNIDTKSDAAKINPKTAIIIDALCAAAV
jgi:hypothetical protein